MFKQQSDKLDSENNPDISGQKQKMDNNYEEAEKEWNSKILKITLKINDQYPELSKFIEEMPVTIPIDNKPEITLENLSAYYESLNVLLNKYIKEHPHTSTPYKGASQTHPLPHYSFSSFLQQISLVKTI